MENEHTMTTAEVAAMLGVHRETIRNWIRCRGLPAIQASRKVIRFSRREVLEWQNRQRPGMQAATMSPAPLPAPTPATAGGAE